MTKPNLIDFEKINQHLLGAGETFLRYLFPNGVLRGHEWCVGSIAGEAGNSLKVNVHSGAWSDFAFSEHRGRDLVSLYATAHNLDQIKAARELQEYLGITPASEPRPRPAVDQFQICAPPLDADPPTFIHPKHGPAAKTWPYTDGDGRVLFYVSRYNLKDGSKEFSPWAWSDSKGAWVRKGFPGSRPLYRLPDLLQRADKPVLIVEGEKAADAAHAFAGGVYVVVSWCGGGNAAEKTDWSPLAGRDLLLWPDADKAGIDCMRDLSPKLANQGCTLKILSVDDQQQGWDAADSGFDWSGFKEWAKPRAVPFRGAEIVRLETVKAQATLDRGKPVPSDMWSTWDQAGLITANGRPVENIENVARVLTHTGDALKIWYDTFHQKIMFLSPNGAREWRDADSLLLTTKFQAEFGFRKISDATVHTAIRALAFKNERDSVKEWIESLKWDGVRRNANFFQDVYGAENTDYTQSVGANFLRSICARATRPGCKVDNMVILEGRQGIGKSESLAILGGGLHTETHEDPNNKDFYMVMQGKLIVVIAEMDAFSKTDMKKVKGIITNKTDRYRTPYDRVVEDHPRRCVFVGDTNEQHYLDDPTGARRFWPIRCTEINWNMLKKNREQYFAEAMDDIKNGAEWHVFDEQAARIEQEQRRIVDEWEPYVADWLVGKHDCTATEVLTECLRIKIGEVTRADQLRVGRVLKVLGWKNKLFRRNDTVTRGWERRYGDE